MLKPVEPLTSANARKHGIADELGRHLAQHEPANVRDAAPLRALRDAVTERGATERRIAEAVANAREESAS